MRKDGFFMIIASILLLGLFIFPMWNISLEAPQYPTPLGMNIHINKFTDANENDIKNINIMNHYIGMKPVPKSIPEFTIFPIVVITMSILGLMLGFIGNFKWFLSWFTLMIILGGIGIYDFYIWEYNYGHSLDPNAIMSFTKEDGTAMGYQPPLFGSKKMLNFTVHTYPRIGSAFMFVSLIFAFMAFLIGRKLNTT